MVQRGSGEGQLLGPGPLRPGLRGQGALPAHGGAAQERPGGAPASGQVRARGAATGPVLPMAGAREGVRGLHGHGLRGLSEDPQEHEWRGHFAGGPT